MDQDIVIPLNSSDLRFLKFTVSTITFFNGTIPQSYLSERTKLIVRANPWLAGYLKRTKEGICLCYSAAHNENEKTLFLTATDTLLHESMDYEELCRRLRGSLVKAGHSCLGRREEPLFLVSDIAISSSKFAVVVSISHTIADGHTFYRLQAMLSQALSPENGVRAMAATRLADFERRMEAFMAGGNDTARFLRSAGVVLKMLCALLRAPRPRAGFWLVDPAWVDAEKKKCAARAAVSSNDVLTSWFFSTCCGSYLGLMSYNFRNRVEGLTDLHAGNYVAPVGFQPADVVSPLLVRWSVASARRQGPSEPSHPHCSSDQPGGGTPFPGFLATLTKAAPLRLSLLTNWAGIYREVHLDGCEPVAHLPLLQGWSAVTDLGIIFRPRRDALAIFVQSSARSCSDEALLSQPALAGRLFPTPLGQVDSAPRKKPTRTPAAAGFLLLVLVCCSGFFYYYYSGGPFRPLFQRELHTYSMAISRYFMRSCAP